MALSAEATETAAGIDGSNVRTNALEKCESSSLRLNFTEDIFADAEAEVRGSAGKPLASLVDEIVSDASRLVVESLFVVTCFIKGGDGLVDLFAAHVAAGLETVGCVEAAAGVVLGLDELTNQNLAVGEGFLDDEGIL